jgi:Protein of unknown function (DUF4199)
MKKIVLKYGLIAGIILAAKIFIMMLIKGDSTDFERGASVGTIFMIGAFSMIFFGIREYRDKISGGVINFNLAFRIGILIAIIASLCYVAGWMINFNYIDTSFVEDYTTYYIEKIKAGGKDPAAVEKEITSFKNSITDYYENPAMIATHTFLEIFPVGLIITVLCALLMRRTESTPETT